jgi:hypothetical protein
MAVAGECDDALASSLSDLPQRPKWTNRSARAQLLGKLATRDLLFVAHSNLSEKKKWHTATIGPQYTVF